MNQEHDKELDLLLKRQAKRETKGAQLALSAKGENGKEAFGSEVSDHLDADEMNAFAENALPQLARVRYTEHLIACDSCRQLVTQFALTANTISFEKKEEKSITVVSSEQTWREWFASLFTLPRLKVAGPIAAVLCFAAITFVALQRNDLKESVTNQTSINNDVAYRETKEGDGDGNTNNPTEQPGKPNNNAQPTNSGKTKPVSNETPSTKTGERSKDSKNEPAPPASTEERRDEPKAPERVITKAADAQPTPVVSQQPSDTSTQNQTQNTVAQETQRQTSPRKGPNYPNRDRSQSNVALGGVTPSKKPDAQDKDAVKEEKKTPPAPAKKQATSDDEDAEVAKSKAASTTRLIEGKKFTRKGNAWVDNAYRGTSTTNIKRGTEEYRSLDSGLRTISDKLDGEVIIVWKSKAYKIY